MKPRLYSKAAGCYWQTNDCMWNPHRPISSIQKYLFNWLLRVSLLASLSEVWWYKYMLHYRLYQRWRPIPSPPFIHTVNKSVLPLWFLSYVSCTANQFSVLWTAPLWAAHAFVCEYKTNLTPSSCIYAASQHVKSLYVSFSASVSMSTTIQCASTSVTTQVHMCCYGNPVPICFKIWSYTCRCVCMLVTILVSVYKLFLCMVVITNTHSPVE